MSSRPRYATTTDANQADIAAGLRCIGATVECVKMRGLDDLIVGWRGRNWLLEVKNPDVDASHRKLTADEQWLHGNWRGQIDVVETLDDALRLIGAIV